MEEYPPLKERTEPITWEETARTPAVLMQTVVRRAVDEIARNMGDSVSRVAMDNDFDTYDLRYHGFCRSGDVIEITIKRRSSKND